MWGQQLGQDVNTIKSVMDDLKSKDQLPDLLLVELGFNDIGWLGAGVGLVDTMKDFVDNARAANPNVAIVLANVPHRTTLGDANPHLLQRTTGYNKALAEAIPTWDTDDSPVVLADLDEALDCDPTATTCATTYDGRYPNALGEYRIAQAFATSLHEEFDIGSSAPEVPDTMPTRQVGTPTDLEFDGTQQGVTVTWTQGLRRPPLRHAVARCHHRLGRRLAGGHPWRTDPSLGPVLAVQRQPHDGHTYEVRVRAIAGDSDDLTSRWSAPVRGWPTRPRLRRPRPSTPPPAPDRSMWPGRRPPGHTPTPSPATPLDLRRGHPAGPLPDHRLPGLGTHRPCRRADAGPPPPDVHVHLERLRGGKTPHR
ncbi:GDSL-type esterase/lipase family protein [Streptomyces sp. CA-251387]|uniref:GDSL-type esterase/lipase family protein n=1 Tax=Streptomyces sp. CA-251387 TaxID=3240064 RepID=UPI003D8FA657